MATETKSDETQTKPVAACARWTGGQYSLFRGLLGLYLAASLLLLLPHADGLSRPRPESGNLVVATFPSVFELNHDRTIVLTVLMVGALACVALAIGFKDRLAAVFVWYFWACLFAQNPDVVGSAFPVMGWVLLAHVCTPPAPFGSFDARGRADPRGDWKMSAGIPLAIWSLLVVMHAYFGWRALQVPAWRDGTAVEMLLRDPLARSWFAVDAILALPSALLAVVTWTIVAVQLGTVLAVFRRLRPFVWMLLVLGSLLSLLFFQRAGESLGMLLLYMLAFDPGWVRPTAADPASTDWLFYDGNCGLCHRSIRLVLAEEPAATIRFAALESEAFRRELTESQREQLPDSVVVKSGDRVLVRSRAALFVLGRLGGWWRVLGATARVVPRPVADRLYDLLAVIRHRLFRKPHQACPLLPPDLRDRFEFSAPAESAPAPTTS